MFVRMELAGIYRYVTVYQVPGLEQLGWKVVEETKPEPKTKPKATSKKVKKNV